MKSLFALSLSAALVLAMMEPATAADIRVTCLKTATRSKISVDAGGLAAGDYRARVISGGVRRTSPLQTALGDEIEFDFDSRPADVAEGATRIGGGFIQEAQVLAKIINAAGRTVISDTELCRVR